VQLTRRTEKVSDQDETLTESELKRRSASRVESFYRDAHGACSLERKPNPKRCRSPLLRGRFFTGGDGNKRVTFDGVVAKNAIRVRLA
jgi:hypothetical protein